MERQQLRPMLMDAPCQRTGIRFPGPDLPAGAPRRILPPYSERCAINVQWSVAPPCVKDIVQDSAEFPSINSAPSAEGDSDSEEEEEEEEEDEEEEEYDDDDDDVNSDHSDSEDNQQPLTLAACAGAGEKAEHRGEEKSQAVLEADPATCKKASLTCLGKSLAADVTMFDSSDAMDWEKAIEKISTSFERDVSVSSNTEKLSDRKEADAGRRVSVDTISLEKAVEKCNPSFERDVSASSCGSWFDMLQCKDHTDYLRLPTPNSETGKLREPPRPSGFPTGSFHQLLSALSAEHDRALEHQRADLLGQMAKIRHALRKAQGKGSRDHLDTVTENRFGQVSDGSPLSNSKRRVSKLSGSVHAVGSECGHVSFEISGSQGIQAVPFTPNPQSMDGYGARSSVLWQWNQDIARQVASPTSLMRRFGSTQAFDTLSTLVIFLVLIMEGWIAQEAISNTLHGDMTEHTDVMFSIVGVIFTVWFVIEILVRLSLVGLWTFFMGDDKAWNWFDVVVVMTDLTLNVLQLITAERRQNMNNITMVRTLRVIRITRAVRVLRLVRLFRELRMMLFSIVQSGSALMWSLVLLAITIYAFSIYFIQVVAFHLDANHGAEGEKELVQMFGSLQSAQYTLYLAVSGGISWGEVSGLLIDIHPFHGIVFCFYTFFTTFALLNIITGIFVETSINSARSNQDELAQEQQRANSSRLERLRKVFAAADGDGSGTMSAEEFENCLLQPEVRSSLAALGIEVEKARGLFNLLDMDMSGEITVEEFTYGCMRLKGEAKSIDVATLTNHTKRMHRQFRKYVMWSESQFKAIHDWERRLDRRLGFFGSTKSMASEHDNSSRRTSAL